VGRTPSSRQLAPLPCLRMGILAVGKGACLVKCFSLIHGVCLLNIFHPADRRVGGMKKVKMSKARLLAAADGTNIAVADLIVVDHEAVVETHDPGAGETGVARSRGPVGVRLGVYEVRGIN